MKRSWAVMAAVAAVFLAGSRANAQLTYVPEAVPQASTSREMADTPSFVSTPNL
jgi:hypothetical protein